MTRHSGKFKIDSDCVVRWKSNNSVPPEECLVEMLMDDDINMYEYTVSLSVREDETQKFLENYRKRMENHVPSEEERFEMKAAFGEGTTVVNAITGQEYKI